MPHAARMNTPIRALRVARPPGEANDGHAAPWKSEKVVYFMGKDDSHLIPRGNSPMQIVKQERGCALSRR